MKKILVAVTAIVTLVLLPTPADAAPDTGGGGAAYGAHVSDHARDGNGFSREMSPGHHRGFAGFDQHDH